MTWPLVGWVNRTFDGLSVATVTGALVVTLPAASVATAVSVSLPLIASVVFHVVLYGAVVSGAPRFVLPSLNCTLVTPVSSLADGGDGHGAGHRAGAWAP